MCGSGECSFQPHGGLLGFNEAEVNILDRRVEPNMDYQLQVVR